MNVGRAVKEISDLKCSFMAEEKRPALKCYGGDTGGEVNFQLEEPVYREIWSRLGGLIFDATDREVEWTSGDR